MLICEEVPLIFRNLSRFFTYFLLLCLNNDEIAGNWCGSDLREAKSSRDKIFTTLIFRLRIIVRLILIPSTVGRFIMFTLNRPDKDGLTQGIDYYFSRGVHDIPENAIKSGSSPCGEVYVGAVKHENITMPCKIIPRDGICYFSYCGKELSSRACTFVVTKPGYTYEWSAFSDGMIPSNAARFGKETNGELYAVGRVNIDQEKCVGKILPSHKICYVPKSSREHQFKFYDVLVIKPMSNLSPAELTPGTSLYYSSCPADVPNNAIFSGMSPCGQVYVGFVQREDETMPAKIVPKHCFAYYTYLGKEYSSAKFTFLTIDSGYSYEWVPDSNGNVPLNSAKLGRTGNGESFYVGRVTMDNEKCVGKILKSQRVCYVPHRKKEHIKKFYDVLVIRKIK